MQDKNLNNAFNWQSKLSELDHVPGEAPLNKDAAWNSLHERMQDKQKTNRTIWYWMAAACVLAVCLLAGLVYNKPADIVVKKDAPPNTENAKTIIPDKEVQKETAVSENIPQPNTTAGLQRPHEKVSPKIKATTKLDPIEIIPGNNEQPLSIIETPVAPIPENISLAVIPPPPPKKLKVVHVNEIGNTMAEPAVMAVKKQNNFVRFNNNNEPASQTLVASDNSGLFIKINPVN